MVNDQVSKNQLCLFSLILCRSVFLWFSSLPSLSIQWMTMLLCNFEFLQYCRFVLDSYEMPMFYINDEINGRAI